MADDRRCGTCKRWAPPDGPIGFCLYPIPPLPASLPTDGAKMVMRPDEGANCPTWKLKEKNDATT